MSKNILEQYPSIKVVLLGNEYDIEESKIITSEVKDCRLINLTGKTNMIDLVNAINQLDIFIGNDSGLMHIADSLQKRMIVFFGPTKYKRWGPTRSRASILCRNVDCSPCSLNTCPHQSCLVGIKPVEAMNEIRKILIERNDIK